LVGGLVQEDFKDTTASGFTYTWGSKGGLIRSAGGVVGTSVSRYISIGVNLKPDDYFWLSFATKGYPAEESKFEAPIWNWDFEYFKDKVGGEFSGNLLNLAKAAVCEVPGGFEGFTIIDWNLKYSVAGGGSGVSAKVQGSFKFLGLMDYTRTIIEATPAGIHFFPAYWGGFRLP